MSFNTGLIRLFSLSEISLLLKIQWKHHHILYVKIAYKHSVRCRKSTLKGREAYVLVKDRSNKVIEMC
jgi:hypothetical protein